MYPMGSFAFKINAYKKSISNNYQAANNYGNQKNGKFIEIT